LVVLMVISLVDFSLFSEVLICCGVNLSSFDSISLHVISCHLSILFHNQYQVL